MPNWTTRVIFVKWVEKDKGTITFDKYRKQTVRANKVVDIAASEQVVYVSHSRHA